MMLWLGVYTLKLMLDPDFDIFNGEKNPSKISSSDLRINDSTFMTDINVHSPAKAIFDQI